LPRAAAIPLASFTHVPPDKAKVQL
jgi:hypothetical protein